MEFGTREILIVLGIVIILGILLDGLRRVRQSRNGTLKVSRRKQAIFDDDIDDISGELPGKVRVIRRDKESADLVSDNIRRSRENNADRCTSAFRQRSANSASNFFTRPESERRDSASDQVRMAQREEGDIYDDSHPQSDYDYDAQVPDSGPVDDEPGIFASHENEVAPNNSWTATREDDEPVAAQPFHLEPPKDTPRVSETPRVKRKPFWEERAPEPPPPPPSVQARETRAKRDDDAVDVIVLHVMAKKDTYFEGEPLLEALLGNGLRYGDMGIFHRHEEENGSGPVHFSLANSVKPGTFDLATIDSFSTPGVTLFMPLDGLSNPLECFSQLIKTAQALAKALGGELKDETRSALTKQTIEHYRQQIIEYTRRSFTLSH